MSTVTTNYSWILPGVNDPTDQDLWGGYLNSNLSAQDTLIKTIQDQANLASPVTNAQTGNYTVLASVKNKTILVDATGGAVTITLLDVATAGDGFKVSVKKIDSTINVVTVEGSGVETIDDALNISLSTQFDILTFICNGSEWFIQSSYSVGAGSSGGCYLTQATGTSVANQTWTDLTWDTELYDDFGWHTGTGSDVVVDFDGYVDVRLSAAVDTGANGAGACRILKNGTQVAIHGYVNTASDTALGLPGGTPTANHNLAEILAVSSGDILKGQVFRNGYGSATPTVTSTTRMVVTKYRGD